MPQPDETVPNTDIKDQHGHRIPKAVIKRISLYVRVLQSLEIQKIEKVSSADLARSLGFSPAQVRKDLGFFGPFGVPGLGYYVSELRHELRRILGKDRTVKVVLIGVGNLGSALMAYKGFNQQGMTMLWGFDSDPDSAQKRSHAQVPVYHIDQLEKRLENESVDIAVLSVPMEEAQGMANRVVKLGVNAILNFVPHRLEVPDHVHVRYVDLSLELESLSYYVRD